MCQNVSTKGVCIEMANYDEIPEIQRRKSYRELSMTVDLEPVCADEMLLVKHGVIGTQEVEILKLKTEREMLRQA